MSKFQILLALNIALVAGWVSGQHSLLVSPASAGTPPQRWDHVCEHAKSKGLYSFRSTGIARAKGSEGWELVSVTFMPSGSSTTTGPGPTVTQTENDEMVFCFKRPM